MQQLMNEEVLFAYEWASNAVRNMENDSNENFSTEEVSLFWQERFNYAIAHIDELEQEL